jgi:regulatory protein
MLCHGYLFSDWIIMSRTITTLKIQERNKERVSVFLDGEYVFSLSLLDAASLHKGQILTDEQIAQLKAIDDRHVAFERAVRFLGHRPRSQQEIRQKLREHDVEAFVIDSVLQRLEQLEYVNDLEFARYWVRNREEFRPRGPMALRAELRSKGIDNDIIDEVLAETKPLDSAREAARKKRSSLRGLDRQTFRKKLGDHLARRGFDFDTITTVIEECLADEE